MALIQDKTKLKQVVGGAISADLQFDSIQPSLETAEQDHLVGWLSAEQYQDLIDSPTTTQNAALLPYAQKVSGWLGCYEYSKVGGVQFGEAGIHRMENEYAKTAYKYQETSLRNQLLKNGYNALELLLEFLEKNKADYPLWAASEAAERNRSMFINTAREMRTLYAHYIDRYVFESIRPVMEDVEDLAIIPILGQAQYDELKTLIADGVQSAGKTKELLKRIKKAVAQFTIREALVRNWVKLSNNNVVTAERLEPQGYEREGSPSLPALSATERRHQLMGDRFIQRISSYLEENPDDFPTYKAWQESQQTTEEQQPELDPRKGYCGCLGSCDCQANTTDTGGGVVLL